MNDDRSKDAVDSNNALWRIPEWFPDLPSLTQERLKLYHGELIRFNSRLNLISRTTERDADEVHFADCLYAVKGIPAESWAFPVHDVGSGNGLPGVVLGLLYPEVDVRLVEGDSRKCEFLKHIIHALQLENVKVMNVRLESLKSANLQVGITRGFASISKTVLACNRTFVRGGKFFHLKSGAWAREVAEIPSQLTAFWSPELVFEYSLPVSQARRGVVLTNKIA